MKSLINIDEPQLLFNHEQATEDPRDGLTLFGPLDRGRPYGIRCGVVGTPDGLGLFRRWLKQIQQPIGNRPAERARPGFPGFEAAFGIPWPDPVHELQVDEMELHRRIRYDDRHQRIFGAVDLYAESILNADSSEDSRPDLWFTVLPDDVYRFCRPLSTVAVHERIVAPNKLTTGEIGSLSKGQGLMFQDDQTTEAAKAYDYDPDFHNQLKARLLERGIVTQGVRESTLGYSEVLTERGKPVRDLSKMQGDIAWHLSTAAFYKSGGRPWKIKGMREGVCYVGIVFKQVQRGATPKTACCAAQMFLDSGDGVVFKGNVGPWYSPNVGDFHLSKDAAREIMRQAIETYRAKKGGASPAELFVHAKTKFNNDEWNGFLEAAGADTKVVAVQIQHDNEIKLFRTGEHPVLRGSALIVDDHSGYLWTKGLCPRLGTYIGREVPNPLLIKICRGTADVEVVLRDVLGLTKLNYNACRYADGEPVTLKFADAVGEVLTAGPLVNVKIPPLPFKHYI